jgi:exopolyphosphatase/guanosine-5'-triphosphate,3'-diphosphate pyrophosphatase
MDTLEEYVDIDLNSAIDMFFRNVKIKNMIATGDYVSYMFAEADMDIKHKEFITAEDYRKQYDRIVKKAMSDSKEYIGGTKIPTEILIPSAVIYKKVLDITGADRIWLPKVKLCDGMVVEYARKSRKLKLTRNFLEDIISAAWVIAKRYEGDTAHLESVEKSALMVFDAMKKYHGLSERERLLLQIAAIVHDCGKYISILEPGQSCYNIIAGTEIIGLSHKERMMVANIARFNTDDFEYEDVLLQEMDRESYMIILKLTAILRICNALDRTHKQKFGNLNISLNKKELIISTETFSNIAIEKGTFEGKAELFEEIYGIKPVLKVKRGEL